MASWRLRDRVIEFPPPIAAGIVNVTDDSFYEGARSGTAEQGVADGLRLVGEGFEMLDVGAVAARSGPPVPAEEEAARLVPAVAALAERAGVPVLADTFSAKVAVAAIEAGAAGINDISGGAEPRLLEAVAASGCGYVLMHIEGPPRTERPLPAYPDPVAHLRQWFERRLAELAELGVDPQQIALDPGLDFDLGVDAGLELMARLGELRELGRPLFVAISRKDFLGAVLAGSWDARVPAAERGPATAAAAALATRAGAEVLRLHDRDALDAMRVAAAITYPNAAPVAADGG